MSCALDGCNDPTCGPCTVKVRFLNSQPSPRALASEGLKDRAPALNGTKQRAVRDPRFMKRKRKALTP